MYNESQEQYTKIAELLSNLDVETAKKLKTMLLNKRDEFNSDPVQTIISSLQEMAKQETEEDGYARTINDEQRIERGKAFVESMSSQAKQYREGLQQERERRYEEMIEEYEEKSNTRGGR